MVRFLDGPASGVTLALRRAPTYLRTVKGEQWDALDQLADDPEQGEEVVAYRRVSGTWGVVFVCRGGRGAGGGRYEHADYRVLDAAVPDGVLREAALWRVWVTLWHADNATTAQAGLDFDSLVDLAQVPRQQVRAALPVVRARDTDGDDVWTLRERCP